MCLLIIVEWLSLGEGTLWHNVSHSALSTSPPPHCSIWSVAKLGCSGLIAIIAALWTGNNVLQRDSKHPSYVLLLTDAPSLWMRQSNGRRLGCVKKTTKKQERRRERQNRLWWETEGDGRGRGRPVSKGWETFLSWHDTKWLKSVFKRDRQKAHMHINVARQKYWLKFPGIWQRLMYGVCRRLRIVFFFSYNAFKSLMDKDMWVRGGVRHKRGTVEGGKTELGYRRGESTVQKGTKKKRWKTKADTWVPSVQRLYIHLKAFKAVIFWSNPFEELNFVYHPPYTSLQMVFFYPFDCFIVSFCSFLECEHKKMNHCVHFDSQPFHCS